MMMLFRISVQLNVESLIVHTICNSSTLEQIAAYFYLITGLILLSIICYLSCSRIGWSLVLSSVIIGK